jgi:acyl carrier protein
MKLSDLSVDSLDIVEFVMSFEDEFDLDVPRQEAVHFDTIRDLVDWARRHGPK